MPVLVQVEIPFNGFDAPISRALGYGKSLHDALAEIHSESVKGRIPTEEDVERLVDSHLHLPFANKEVKNFLEKAAKEALARYLRDHGENLNRLEHVEKTIELKLDGGVVVSGRVDLIRRTDTDEIVIVDFKSDERAQAEDVTQKQLHVYAVGYQQLTGKNADLIEIHNLDKGGAKREVVDGELIRDTIAAVTDAGKRLKGQQTSPSVAGGNLYRLRHGRSLSQQTRWRRALTQNVADDPRSPWYIAGLTEGDPVLRHTFLHVPGGSAARPNALSRAQGVCTWDDAVDAIESSPEKLVSGRKLGAHLPATLKESESRLCPLSTSGQIW